MNSTKHLGHTPIQLASDLPIKADPPALPPSLLHPSRFISPVELQMMWEAISWGLFFFVTKPLQIS